jgi:hypothetical protein
MRIFIAGFLFAIAAALGGRVDETTVFHSLNGTNYFRGSEDVITPPTEVTATSPNATGESVPQR